MILYNSYSFNSLSKRYVISFVEPESNISLPLIMIVGVANNPLLISSSFASFWVSKFALLCKSVSNLSMSRFKFLAILYIERESREPFLQITNLKIPSTYFVYLLPLKLNSQM